jgi:hypothetical protein
LLLLLGFAVIDLIVELYDTHKYSFGLYHKSFIAILISSSARQSSLSSSNISRYLCVVAANAVESRHHISKHESMLLSKILFFFIQKMKK